MSDLPVYLPEQGLWRFREEGGDVFVPYVKGITPPTSMHHILRFYRKGGSATPDDVIHLLHLITAEVLTGNTRMLSNMLNIAKTKEFTGWARVHIVNPEHKRALTDLGVTGLPL